jgi:adenosylhomocysteine nucleosidase
VASNIFSVTKRKMDRGKRFAIQALDFRECFISVTIGTANTFHYGPWPCIGIYGRAGRCGLTNCGSRYLRPAVSGPIIEQSAGVLHWRAATPLRIFVNPIAIFAATRWELQAVRRGLATDHLVTIAGVRCHIGQQEDRIYWLIQTGVGPAAAGTIARKVLKAQPMSLVISTGFACALVPAQIGDLIVGTAVSSVDGEGAWMMRNDRVLCDGAVRAGLLIVAQHAGLAVRVGTVVSSRNVVWQAEEKRRLRRATEATGLDMESAAVAAVAQEQGLPMAIVRTVSDLADEDLPLDFNLFLRPTGWIKGMQALISCPSSIVGLNRLRKQSRVAADRLTEWFQRYGETGGASLRPVR